MKSVMDDDEFESLPLKHMIEGLMTLNATEYNGASFQSLEGMAWTERFLSGKTRLYKFLRAVFLDLHDSLGFQRLHLYPLVQQHIQACIAQMIASEMLMRRLDYFVCYRVVGDKILSYEVNSFLLYLLHTFFSSNTLHSTNHHGSKTNDRNKEHTHLKPQASATNNSNGRHSLVVPPSPPPLICTPSLRDNDYPLNMQSLLAFFDKSQFQQTDTKKKKAFKSHEDHPHQHQAMMAMMSESSDDEDLSSFETAKRREFSTDMDGAIQVSVLAANCSLRVTDAKHSRYVKYARGLSHEREAPPTTFVNGYDSAAVLWIEQCARDVQLVLDIPYRTAHPLIEELIRFYHERLAPRYETKGHLLQICMPRVGGLDLESYAYLSLAWGSPVHVWEKANGQFEIRSVYEDVEATRQAGCIRRVPMAEVLHMPEMTGVQLRFIAHPNLFLQHGVFVGNLQSASEQYDRAALFHFMCELFRPYYTGAAAAMRVKPIHWSRWAASSPP